MKHTVAKITLSCAMVLGMTTPMMSNHQAHAETMQYDLPMKTGKQAPLYDFGANTSTSGLFKAMDGAIDLKNQGKPLKVWREIPKKAQIALIGNISDDGKTYGYGTSTAIGKHTLLTSAHNVQKPNPTKSYQTNKLSKLFVQPQRNGNSAPHTLKVTKVDMIRGGDVALVHTKEDLSKYMKIRPLASESKIKKMKKGVSLELNHYSKHTRGYYENDPAGSMYQSHGQFVMRGSNIHPVTYIRMRAGIGASGGALLNKNGEVTGVIVAKYTSEKAIKGHLNAGFNLTDDIRKNMKGKVY